MRQIPDAGRRVTGAPTATGSPLPAALLLLLLAASAGGGAHAPDPVGPGASGASGASATGPAAGASREE
jgi:hypothetical protein